MNGTQNVDPFVHERVKNVPQTGLKVKGKETCASFSHLSKPKEDFQSRNMAAQTEEQIARDVAYGIIYHITKIKTKKVKPQYSVYATTMERTVDELSVKHEIFFTSAMKRLEVNEESARATIDNVANEMFSDKNFNWGRLVTLYAFCGRVAKYCSETNVSNKKDLVEKIADYTADYVAEVLSNRIQHHGGWDAFVDFFHQPVNMEEKLWKGLLYTVVGLGALAGMVAVR